MAKKQDKPRGRGRPATGQMPKRYFRLDDETWAMIVAAAESGDETISEYIRRVLVKDASRVARKTT